MTEEKHSAEFEMLTKYFDKRFDVVESRFDEMRSDLKEIKKDIDSVRDKSLEQREALLKHVNAKIPHTSCQEIIDLEKKINDFIAKQQSQEDFQKGKKLGFQMSNKIIAIIFATLGASASGIITFFDLVNKAKIFFSQ